ncbi:MAG TPA: hypothetical protein VNH83_16620 [Bryobacteraceae bacterium]|nr:hypothetical protein [Bryobacteraceae bacterium]
MQVLAIRDVIFDEQPGPNHFEYQGLAINAVIREGLSFQLARASLEVPIVVREIQRCDEE